MRATAGPRGAYVLTVPELLRLRASHAALVLAFDLDNRAYFAASVSDRGKAFFSEFDERFREALAEQETGACAFHVVVGDDGAVLGRFNLYDIADGGAVLGYRVAERAAGRGLATEGVVELCRTAARRYGLRTLRAAVADRNVASRRVLAKAGFVPDGRADPAGIGGHPGAWYRRELDAPG